MTQFAIPNADPVATLTFEDVVTVDISTFTGSGDYISLSLPEFPKTKFNLAQTFIDFTSNEKGNFGVGPTDEIPFSQGTFVGTQSNKDTELRIPISQLTKCDKSAISGVRFRLFATEATTFRCLSIRACAESWKYAPIDFDTLWHRIHRPPSQNGSQTPEENLLLPEETLLPEEELLPKDEFGTAFPEGFPIVFRSNALQGLSDPEPINLTVSTAFTTGSFGQASGEKKNEIGLYFRDIPTDNQTMIEVDTKTMAELDSVGKQPDFGKALFNARDQEEIDTYDQFELDERTQYSIERKRDESEHTWMEARLKWGATTASNELVLHDADGLGYKWTGIALEASKASEQDKGRYILIVRIQDTWMRVKIYQLNQTGSFVSETAVFDTGKITDENLIKRRKGRFGWFARLFDGDAHIDNIKSRGVNFGEMISKPFESITPVKGVQLFTGSTADKELITGFERTQPEYTTLTPDPNASAGGKAIKVVTTPLRPLQGISSNTFQIDEPSNISISFDIKFPASEIPGGQLIGFLLGPNENALPIDFSPYTFGQWSHVRVRMPETLYQTGGYKVIIMQSLPVAATTWWIENLSAKTYTVKWSARAKKPDAWGAGGQRWREAGFTLNSLNGGIVFPERGNQLQIRAQALRQDAVISDFKAIPQYATLGNIFFSDEHRGPIEVQTKFASSGTTIEPLWLNPSRITADDESDAQFGTAEVSFPALSGYLYAKTFNFSIPSEASIKGIEVMIKRRRYRYSSSKDGQVFDNTVQLLKSGSPIGENLAHTSTVWGQTYGVSVYGGTGALWNTTWTPANINASTFGVALIASVSNEFISASVDYIKISVSYAI